MTKRAIGPLVSGAKGAVAAPVTVNKKPGVSGQDKLLIRVFVEASSVDVV
jgi:hypothetical protein